MSSSPRDILRHILDEADFLLAQSVALSLDDFLRDAVRQRAFVRSLEIIGEAAGKLPDDLKQRHGVVLTMLDQLAQGHEVQSEAPPD